MTNQNQQKIAELEEKIRKLQEIYKSDVRESYREAQQTQEMIQMLNRRLEMLRDEEKRGKN
ncbi:hypothetical protein JW978_03420 [Candidatus Dojkabacteria bacterium]|nr:hypothetical protein [Candidatus Dojkabacteria bacterium]